LSIVIFINFQYFSVIISIFSLLGLETQKSTAIIVSLHNEVIYKMDDDVLTGENLSKFVENFHKNLETLKVLKLSKTILNKATVDSNNPMQELNASTFAETLLKTHRTEPG
jgi:preprotein translocase subunit SecA